MKPNQFDRGFGLSSLTRPMQRSCGFFTAVIVSLMLLSRAAWAGPARWISIGSGAEGNQAAVKAAAAADGQLNLQFAVPGFWVEEVEKAKVLQDQLTVPDSGFTAAVGDPQLPVIRRILEAPIGAQVTATVDAKWETKSLAELGIKGAVLPLQNPIPKLPGAVEAAPFVKNAAAYAQNAFMPASAVSVSEAGAFAGRRLVLAEVAPIRYNPVLGQLSMASALTVTVSFTGGAKNASAISAREDALLSNMTLNHTASADQAKSGGRLLIICSSSLTSGMSGFVAHKQSMGWTVDLVDTSTTGTTTATIKSYVQTRYNNLATRPDALLLVGDTTLIGYFVGVGADSPDTDLYYACMDAGDDWQPEFPVGRFSVTTTAQLAAVVNKTIEYETSTAAAWRSHAVFMASTDNHSISEGTHNYVIDNYLQPRGYLSDKLYSYTYSATPAQVTAAFNDGRVLGIYSGHGAETYWADGPVFYQSDVNNLVNAGKYPFVCSFACLTGRFSYNQSECFAETWQRGANKGAVEVWASSVTSYWNEDDILEKRLFSAIYDNGFYEIGKATWQAKALYLQYWGALAMTRRYFEMYNLFGDPTVELAQPGLAVVSSSPLPLAFVGESYSTSLSAVGGTRPYSWAVIDGALPDGLSLSSNGVISGTPNAVGTPSFTVQATDALQSNAVAVLQLPVRVRLAIDTPTNLPPAILSQPYTVTLSASGGTSPYTWQIGSGGGYAESNPGPGWIGYGTAQGWHADDASWSLTLPWAFPFYGSNRTVVYISSNGYIDFDSGSSDWNNSDAGLIAKARIAALWDDLVTEMPPDDIFIMTNSSLVAIRWQAHVYSTTNAVNVETVLYRDGSIKFNYGPAHTGLTPSIGISRGDGTHYTLSTRDNAASIPANVSSRFDRTGVLPPGLVISSSGVISGTPTQCGTFVFPLHVADSGAPGQAVDQQFRICVGGVPRITTWTFPGAGGGLTFTTDSGATYRVEYCSDLCQGDWQVLRDNVIGTGNAFSVNDPDAGTVARRFYRVRLW